MYKLFFKRFLDFSFSLSTLIILSPVMILVMLCLLVANERTKVFFYQMRPGKNEALFKIIKFKTMNDKRDKNGDLLPDGERLTKIGKLLRSTSLDELPQLINVLKGDMSLIGPRPLLVQYLTLYNKQQARRHEVRPGITGWAQVNGRNAIDWGKKFELDEWYVDHITFLFDIKIVLLTIKKVLRREEINSDKFATMEAFKGNVNNK
jgi:undecaprenyl phosphate N,N'-diacetylbacillosamine 1-phosphate transferase